MSGTLFEELKKNDLTKKREKAKFLSVLFLTNLFMALFCWSLFSESPKTATKVIPHKKIHERYKMIVSPLIMMAEIDPTLPEVPVTLISKNKTVLIQKAFLHETIKEQNLQGLGQTLFKIEIPEDEIMKIGQAQGETMIAVPEIKRYAPLKIEGAKRNSKYEIAF